jgi:hypothetical protein
VHAPASAGVHGRGAAEPSGGPLGARPVAGARRVDRGNFEAASGRCVASGNGASGSAATLGARVGGPDAKAARRARGRGAGARATSQCAWKCWTGHV